MTSQFRAELLKIRSTRTTAGIVLGMIGIILLFSLLTGLLTKVPNLVATGDQRNLLGVGDLAGVFSALAGIMAVTSEYRYALIEFTTAHLLGPAAGGLVLVAWAATFSVLGTAVAIRRDVN